MCLRCEAESVNSFCDPCLLVLEMFDSSYRSGVRLTSVEGWQAIKKEQSYARV